MAPDLVNQNRLSTQKNVYDYTLIKEEEKNRLNASQIFDVAVLEVIFERPAGPPMVSVKEFISERMDSVSFLEEDIILSSGEKSVSVEKDNNQLNWNRLLDTYDDYDEILFNEQKKIVLKDGEYVFAVPEPPEAVVESSS